VGSDSDTSGNSFAHSVSKQFDALQLRELYRVMNSPETTKRLRELTCGRELAGHEFSVTLWREGEYRERQVRAQMTPRLYDQDPCLNDAINYLFPRIVEDMDGGPPIDYGYKDPLTGKPLDTKKWADYVPPAPLCDCSTATPPAASAPAR
jgi:hypothetical protein